MKFQFYNSYTKKVEEFSPIQPGKVKIYSCGPTVYDLAHIGNFRSYIFTDLLRRSLELGGYQVEHAMNITDVDDKTIQRTLQKNPDPSIQDLGDYTEFYTKSFFEDLDALLIQRAGHYPRATAYVDSMVDLTSRLVDKNIAYELDGSVYFSISKFDDYGKLSGVDLSSVKNGVRYSADEYTKEDVRDFVLWKAEKESEKISWSSPWGKGRPGWHLECSAMIQNIFSGPVDIHTGGIDLLFPHHENEIAQSVNAYGHEFVKYWLHCEHLLVDGRKMSKSEGNFYTLRDLLQKGYSALAVRYFLLSSHYRQKLNFTLEALGQSAQTLRRIAHFAKRLDELKSASVASEAEKTLLELAKGWVGEFLKELQDDLNTSRALAVFHEAMRKTQSALDETGDTLSPEGQKLIREVFGAIDSVIGVMEAAKKEDQPSEFPEEVVEMLKKRTEARKNKDFAESDRLRDEIAAAGYEILDTPEGSRLRKRL